MGEQVSPCTAPALAILLGDLKDPGTLLLGAVEVIGNGDVALSGGIQEVILKRVAGAAVADPERAVSAVVFVIDALVVLIKTEVGQHIIVGPAVITQRGPVIVVFAVATDIDHGIDGGGAAQALATGLETLAAIQAFLRHSFHDPVVDGFGEHGHGAGGHIDQQPITLAPCLQQTDAGVRVFTQSPGQGAPCGSPTDNEIVKVVFHGWVPFSCLLFPVRLDRGIGSGKRSLVGGWCRYPSQRQ